MPIQCGAPRSTGAPRLPLKTLIDRMYDYRDGEPNRKNLAFFQQGGDPKQGSLDMNDYIIGRVASLYGMSLAGTSDSADGISALRSAIQATQ